MGLKGRSHCSALIAVVSFGAIMFCPLCKAEYRDGSQNAAIAGFRF